MLGLVGVGRWGQNLARNFYNLDFLSAVCDQHQARLEPFESWSGVMVTTDYQDLLNDTSITAVAIATRADSHFDLAKEALEAGKDVYCEKPLCLRVEDAADLAALAASGGRILMVGHLLRYHPAVVRLGQLIADGAVGDVHYIASNRLNLGVIGMEGSALWDLAPHDISVILALLGDEMPLGVRCFGGAYVNAEMVDLGLLGLEFSGGRRAHVHFSWLNPYKEHRLTVIGSGGMAVFDDAALWENKLSLFRKPIRLDSQGKPTAAAPLPERISLEPIEPLQVECHHFVDCCQTRRTPRTDGTEALSVLCVIDAAHASCQKGGERVALQKPQYCLL